MNRNNMQENPLLHNVTQLAGGVLLKNVKYFEVMLNIFEFSWVWGIVESWLVYGNQF